MVFRKIGHELGLGGKKHEDESQEEEADATSTSANERQPDVTEAPNVDTQPPVIDPSWSVADPAVETVVGEMASESAPERPTPEPGQLQEQPAIEVAAPAHQTYTVQEGDTLSAIAQRFYGDANTYSRIFDANRDKLDDPNLIQPGQELVIPA